MNNSNKLSDNKLETYTSRKFLNEFIEKHGRRPRILHIGNVANNAYNNAKILNNAGIENDVICYDYYHIMACPEWEDALFDTNQIDQFNPDWKSLDLQGFKRPQWFVQGPLFLCMEYLKFKASGDKKKQAETWHYLSVANKTINNKVKKNFLLPHLNKIFLKAKYYIAKKYFFEFSHRQYFWRRLKESIVRLNIFNFILFDIFFSFLFAMVFLFYCIVSYLIRFSAWLKKIIFFLAREDCANAAILILERISNNSNNNLINFFIYFLNPTIFIGVYVLGVISRFFFRIKIHRVKIVFKNSDSKSLSDSESLDFSHLIEEFSIAFPNRLDKLDLSDFAIFNENLVCKWQELFDKYDIVQAYSTDPIFPMIAKKSPYFAYEHGTIREIPFMDNSQSRLTALSYKLADGVFVTNADNIAAAQKLCIKSKTHYLPHAFDYRKLHAFAGKRLLDSSRNKVFRIFSPCRQHWVDNDPSAAKGNDILIRALPILVNRGMDFVVSFIEWGMDVKASKELISELNLDEYVEWLAPMQKHALWEEYLCSDVVVDQFLISAISGVTFEALSLGCPVITADDGVYNKKFFGEAPPLISAWTSDQVANSIETLYENESIRLDFKRKSIEWIKLYHSPEKVLDIQVKAYSNLI